MDVRRRIPVNPQDVKNDPGQICEIKTDQDDRVALDSDAAEDVEIHDESLDDKSRKGANSDLSKTIPSGTNKTPDFLLVYLSVLPLRWQNWVIRGIFTLLMSLFFAFVVYLGPLALMITTLCVQVKSFAEIINIGYAVYRIHSLPWFRSLSWYFLIASNYLFYGENLVDYFGIAANRTEPLRVLVKYHRFISFSLYIIGFVWFVLSLVKKNYMKQFSLFAWTHIALLIVVTQSYFIIQNIFEGLIWFIVPVSMVIINDICAYMVGFFIGRTPLIRLSPKKTWEGYIGGGFFTVIFGCLISHLLCRYDYFVCPVVFDEDLGRMSTACERSYLFRLEDYTLPLFLSGIMKMRFYPVIRTYPFVIHSFYFALFSSIIGPFGGLFASGFKRAFKIKDFGDFIPGHGGIMDRFDCQYLMATFVKVYISSFIISPSPQHFYSQLLKLPTEHQLVIYKALQESLEREGYRVFVKL
ncbi:phosphatidate cytidylyltransferase, photoreceptor-specific-like [Artemia franciscana]|uniref:Phosphatidate cytidylyltransferase n=1 Tax=Artemia franciscana TaxID=6661 RepID=A0AA88KUG4_ARTSF|nr:hypothetical protein QYM36_018570 [Artemia franciscana]